MEVRLEGSAPLHRESPLIHAVTTTPASNAAATAATFAAPSPLLLHTRAGDHIWRISGNPVLIAGTFIPCPGPLL